MQDLPASPSQAVQVRGSCEGERLQIGASLRTSGIQTWPAVRRTSTTVGGTMSYGMPRSYCRNGHELFGNNLMPSADRGAVCRECAYARRRRSRLKHLEEARKHNREFMKGYCRRPEVKKMALLKQIAERAIPEKRIKHKARWDVANAIKLGKMFRSPCSCGNTKSEAHHEDYSKPLVVKWLCRRCHNILHGVGA